LLGPSADDRSRRDGRRAAVETIARWRGAKRAHLFPAEQFDERGRPLEGLERVVGRFGDGYAAWVWLTTELTSLDGARPLTLLARGEVGRVANAAEGDLQGDFA